MTVPNAERAIVPEAKIIHYLLSETHPEGKDKAAFFLRFGFTAADWGVLADALLEHVQSYAVTKRVESRYGVRYVVEGALSTPDERNPDLRSVWFIASDGDVPQLVTAYPL